MSKRKDETFKAIKRKTNENIGKVMKKKIITDSNHKKKIEKEIKQKTEANKRNLMNAR